MRTVIATLLILVGIPLFATPSTLVTIPSTDIQPTGVWHLGADSTVYFGGLDAPASFVDLGLTYGITPRLEAGIDLISGSDNPVWGNAKVLLLPAGKSPVAVAAGVYNAGTSQATNQSVLYAIGSAIILDGTRMTFGGYKGNGTALGGTNSSGILAGLDRTMGRWWLGADYVSGDNALSSINYGVGYALTDRIGIIVGYDDYKAGPNAVNFQLDVNL